MEQTFNVISDTKVEVTTMVPQTIVYDISEFAPQMALLDSQIADLQAQKVALQAKIDNISAPLREFQLSRANPGTTLTL